MRALLILVAVSYCSAQMVLPYAAQWPLTADKLITTPGFEVEPLATPYMHMMHPFAHPLATPYAHPLATPYAHPYGFIKPDPAFEATEFPFILKAKTEEASRRRRDVSEVSVPLPYLRAVPAVATTTLTTKQLEPVEAATPADTTKLELTTKEHEFKTPTVKYEQAVMNIKPITYSAISPAYFPWMVTV